MADFTREDLVRAVADATLSEAAKQLGISRRTLRRLLDAQGVDVTAPRGRTRTLPVELGHQVYQAMQAGRSIREAAEDLGVLHPAAYRHGTAYAAAAGLPWPPPVVAAPPSEGERCYRARERGLSWDQVARQEFVSTGGRTTPEHFAMTVAKRWARASGADWPVNPTKA